MYETVDILDLTRPSTPKSLGGRLGVSTELEFLRTNAGVTHAQNNARVTLLKILLYLLALNLRPHTCTHLILTFTLKRQGTVPFLYR
jgi:hypothetical protein